MNNPKHHPTTRYAFLICVCSLILAGFAVAQTETEDNAQTLLESVKRKNLERVIAAKKTEMNRLAEDLAKRQKEAAEMEANVETTAKLVKESGTQIEKLHANKKRLEQVLELTRLRIEAETLKAQGLKMLGDAQVKSLAALKKHSDETTLRSTLAEAELKEIDPTFAQASPEASGNAAATPSGKPAGDKARSPISDLRKKLLTSISAADSAEKTAHEAMRAAATQLEQANVASGKAKRRAATVEGDIPPIAEKPLDLEEKAGDQPEKSIPPK